MGEVKTNNSISIMKYNNLEQVDIMIRDNDDYEITIVGDDVKYLYEILREWLANPVEALVMQTNTEYWCEECKTICTLYEQGLSCLCSNRWETEKNNEEDYPKKWSRVKVSICSV